MSRTHYDVINEGTDYAPLYVTYHSGQRIEATNPFLLDSRLAEAGAPAGRDLHLIPAEES